MFISYMQTHTTNIMVFVRCRTHVDEALIIETVPQAMFFLQIQKQWRPEISTVKSCSGYTILLVLAWPQAFSSTWISGTTLVRILLLHYSKVDCNLCSGGLLTIPWLILRTNIRADHSYNDVIDDGINLLGPLLQPTTYLPFWIFFWANIPIPSWAPI